MGEEESRGSLRIFEAICVLLNHDEKLLNFIFEAGGKRLRERAGILKEDSWNFEESEQLLIRVALDLWSGSGHVQLWELTEAWNQSDWQRFDAAIQLIASA